MPLDVELCDFALRGCRAMIGRAYADALEAGVADPVVVLAVAPHSLRLRVETRHKAASRFERLKSGTGRAIMSWPEDRPCTVLVAERGGLRVAHLALDEDRLPVL